MRSTITLFFALVTLICATAQAQLRRNQPPDDPWPHFAFGLDAAKFSYDTDTEPRVSLSYEQPFCRPIAEADSPAGYYLQANLRSRLCRHIMLVSELGYIDDLEFGSRYNSGRLQGDVDLLDLSTSARFYLFPWNLCCQDATQPRLYFSLGLASLINPDIELGAHGAFGIRFQTRRNRALALELAFRDYGDLDLWTLGVRFRLAKFFKKNAKKNSCKIKESDAICEKCSEVKGCEFHCTQCLDEEQGPS